MVHSPLNEFELDTAFPVPARDPATGLAARDVTTNEPRPPGSPLWTLPNVLISPHTASAMPEENRRATEIFCYNLRCYLDGRPDAQYPG
jgi:phosphoglycerate dehydrogenase-like enzyme